MSGQQMELPWHQGTGAERKEAALTELASLRKDALDYIRRNLIQILRRRTEDWMFRRIAGQETQAFVCADDAARLFEVWQVDKPRVPRAFLGAVFKAEGWKPLSKHPDHPSTQPKNHGRLLLRWTHHAPGA